MLRLLFSVQHREVSLVRLAGIRSWRVKGFVKVLVFYFPENDGIEIVRLLHTSQDIDAILTQEEP